MELFLITLISILIALYFYTTRKSVKYMETIPTPPSNSWFGNIGEFLYIPSHKYFEKFMKIIQYGSLLRVKIGFFTSILLVTDQKFIECVLSSTKHISKADQYEYFHNAAPSGLVTSNGNEWKQSRHRMTPAFHFSLMEQFVDIFEKFGDILLGKLEKLVDKDSVEIHQKINLYTLDIILEATMGTSIDAQNNENSNYIKMIKLMGYIINSRFFFPVPNILYFLTPLYYKEKKAIRVIHSFAEDVIEGKLKKSTKHIKNTSVESDENGDIRKFAFLNLLIQNNNLSKSQLRDELNTIITAGYDTTATAISYALYALANHPEIQEKVLEEQRQIFGEIENVLNPGSKLKEMKYLELVIKETLRMYTVVPFIARKLEEDLEFGGNVFPKGLNCAFLLHCMHMSPENFPDPNKFKPERFLEKNEKHNFLYLPFSAGPRSCIGKKFAWLEMKSGISKIVRKFELLPANPNPPLQLAPEIVMVSKNGTNISIKRRQTKINHNKTI